MEIACNSFQMLRIHIGRNKEEKDKHNFYEKLVKMNNKLQM